MEVRKTGFIRLPVTQEDQKIKFKSDKEGIKEKIEASKIYSIHAFGDDNRLITFYAFPIQRINLLNLKLSPTKKKFWMQKIKGDKLGLYITYTTDGISQYYMKKEKENFAFLIYYESDIMDVAANRFNYLKGIIGRNFKEDCPNLVNLIDEEDYVKNGKNGVAIMHIIDSYDRTCGNN